MPFSALSVVSSSLSSVTPSPRFHYRAGLRPARMLSSHQLIMCIVSLLLPPRSLLSPIRSDLNIAFFSPFAPQCTSFPLNSCCFPCLFSFPIASVPSSFEQRDAAVQQQRRWRRWRRRKLLSSGWHLTLCLSSCNSAIGRFCSPGSIRCPESEKGAARRWGGEGMG